MTTDPPTSPRDPDLPLVSVVVPFRDAADHLPGLLAALAAQTVPPGTVECVLVDNGSRDDGPGVVRAALDSRSVRGRLVSCPRPPSSYAARNAGVDRAAGEILAFTDADCRPAPDWLAAIQAHLADPATRDAVLAGAVDLPVDDPHNPWELFDHAVHLDNASAARNGRVATANMAVRSDVFAAVGPFPVLTSGGDHLWSRQARDCGHAVVYAPDVVVSHPTRTTRRELVAKLARTSRGQGEAAARQPALRVTNTLRALGRPWLVHRHLQVAATPAASGGIGLRLRLFATSVWLRCSQVPPYFAGLRAGPAVAGPAVAGPAAAGADAGDADEDR